MDVGFLVLDPGGNFLDFLVPLPFPFFHLSFFAYFLVLYSKNATLRLPTCVSRGQNRAFPKTLDTKGVMTSQNG